MEGGKVGSSAEASQGAPFEQHGGSPTSSPPANQHTSISPGARLLVPGAGCLLGGGEGGGAGGGVLEGASLVGAHVEEGPAAAVLHMPLSTLPTMAASGLTMELSVAMAIFFTSAG